MPVLQPASFGTANTITCKPLSDLQKFISYSLHISVIFQGLWILSKLLCDSLQRKDLKLLYKNCVQFP